MQRCCILRLRGCGSRETDPPTPFCGVGVKRGPRSRYDVSPRRPIPLTTLPAPYFSPGSGLHDATGAAAVRVAVRCLSDLLSVLRSPRIGLRRQRSYSLRDDDTTGPIGLGVGRSWRSVKRARADLALDKERPPAESRGSRECQAVVQTGHLALTSSRRLCPMMTNLSSLLIMAFRQPNHLFPDVVLICTAPKQLRMGDLSWVYGG
jgi:hypothetical protein